MAATGASSKQNASQEPRKSQSADEPAVYEILRDTIQLLDVLDQKLVSVNNQTPSALMRDNLRALELDQGRQQDDDEQAETSKAKVGNLNRMDDDELTKLAESLSPSRKLSVTPVVGHDSMVAAASEQVAQAIEFEEGGPGKQKRARQLLARGPPADDDSHLGGHPENDSTERHIRFTLNLMQAIFSSQSYTSKTNSLESFLISPLSIQQVLMMMHVGARGQTRRELANCLHLLSPSPLQVAPHHHQDKDSSSPTDPSSKLKRRHQLAQQRPSQPNSASRQSQTMTGHLQMAVHELFGAATRNLLKDPAVTKALTSANQIFAQKNLPLSPQFQWAMRYYYGAELRPVDFQHQGERLASNSSSAELGSNVSNIQQMINDWVERQTKGRISNFLSAPVPNSTLLMALNVIFFKGDWQYKFDPADTQTDATFTLTSGKAVKMPMMVNKLPLAFAHDANIKAAMIELPYKAQRLGLFILLPDDTSGIYQLMQQLNSTTFANLISSMRKPSPMANEQGPGGINVRIPKFSIDSSPRLSQVLSQQLGLKTLFAPDTADLSGMFTSSLSNGGKRSPTATAGNGSLTNDQSASNSNPFTPQVGLDELLHKAVLQVDEQGSVAAASSATIVERVGLFNSHYFEADHPFLLFLMDKQTGLVLFSGAFAGPNVGNLSDGESSNSNITTYSPPNIVAHKANQTSSSESLSKHQ